MILGGGGKWWIGRKREKGEGGERLWKGKGGVAAGRAGAWVNKSFS